MRGIDRDRDEVPHHRLKLIYRRVPACATGEEALGLGLAIARATILGHWGMIDALSDGAGKGATVRVRLPLA